MLVFHLIPDFIFLSHMFELQDSNNVLLVGLRPLFLLYLVEIFEPREKIQCFFTPKRIP